MFRVRPAILWIVTTSSALILSACCSSTPAMDDEPTVKPGATPRPAQPAAEQAEPTVFAADDTEVREVPGKARITFLAHGRNAFIGRLEMEPGGKVPLHRDTTEEYIHVLEGQGTMWIDGKQYDIRPGTTVFMPANAEVRYENGDARLVAIQVFAGPAPAAKYDADAWQVTRKARGQRDADDNGNGKGNGE